MAFATGQGTHQDSLSRGAERRQASVRDPRSQVWWTIDMGESDPERDRKADEREAALDRREHALADRLGKEDEINAAAEKRDAVSEARDQRADNREEAIARARSYKEGFSHDPGAPGRRAAALDREHAKGDREASEEDRNGLSEDEDEDRDDPAVP